MKSVRLEYRISGVLLVACFLLLLWACGRSQPRLYEVQIKDMKFQPASLEIRQGDTVQWINQDMVAHDVTEETKKEWHSSPLGTGNSYKRAFTQSVDYFCNIHQVMKGKIIVK